MSITTRQKLKEMNKALGILLREGRYPSLSEILAKVYESMSGKPWGQPSAKLRPAIHGFPIGGKDGKDIERTYTEIQSDVELLYEETVSVSESLLGNYLSFSAQKDYYRKKLSGISKKLDSLLSYISKGARQVFYDSFTNADQVNLSASTVELSVEEGAISLPKSTSILSPYDFSKATIVSENIVGDGKILASINGALTDSKNTSWQALLNNGSYEVVFDMTGIDIEHSTSRLISVNAFYIEPAGSMSIAAYYSNDSYNFYPLFSGVIDSPKTWSFSTVEMSHIKLVISGKNIGIRKMRPLVIRYDNKGTFYSTQLVPTDSAGNIFPIQSASLSIDKEEPIGTKVTSYIMPCDYYGVPLGTWSKIGIDPISMSRISTETIDIEPQIEDDSADIKFYYHSLSENLVIDGTESLVKANRQFAVDYFNYDWSLEDDTSHVPTPEDFNRFSAETKSGFFDPISYSENPSALGTYDYMKSNQNMLCESDMLESTTSTIQRGWLVVGLKDGSGSSLLMPNGNYRFTAYVYCPNAMMLKDRPVFVYNPSLYGGTGTPEIAPFAIYLNDSRLFYSKKSFTSLDNTSLFNYRVSYPFVQGWNKLEIYIYYPKNPTMESTDIISPCNLGLYMNPNVLTFNESTYRVQGTKGFQQKVSEFILRYNTPPKVNNTWSLIPMSDTVDIPHVLLNYCTSGDSNASNFDGLNKPRPTKLGLSYSKNNNSQAMVGSLIVRLDLEKDQSIATTPRVNGYTLYIN